THPCWRRNVPIKHLPAPKGAYQRCPPFRGRVMTPGAASSRRATSSGLKMIGSLRGSCTNVRCWATLARRGRTDDGRRADVGLVQVQLEKMQIFGRGRVRRSTKEGRESLDRADVVALRLGGETADGHVL